MTQVENRATYERAMSSRLVAAGVAAATSVLLSFLLSACGPDDVVERAEVARPVKMITIGLAAADETLEIPGSIYAAQSAELGFEVAGRMSERLVEEGQVVTAGQIVAKLDARDYLVRRDRARANRDTAKADYDRYTKAYTANAVTEQEVSRAKGQFDVFQADLDVAQKALDDTGLRAPFDGRIAKRLVDDFANVNAKQAVMILQDESSLELRVDVSERDWVQGDSSLPRDEVTKRIKPRVQVASLGERFFPAYLKELSNSADPVTRTYGATFGFANPADANLSPGMTGRVIVDRYRENISAVAGLAVPSNAVIADADGHPFVWVVDAATMRVSKRPVELGELSGGNASVLSGLSSGDRVIVSGVNSVTENMLVRELESN
jgi:RND family efflux transporter MFP subunit